MKMKSHIGDGVGVNEGLPLFLPFLLAWENMDTIQTIYRRDSCSQNGSMEIELNDILWRICKALSVPARFLGLPPDFTIKVTEEIEL